jgi:hypothetical protein
MNTLRDYFDSYNRRIFPLQIVMAVVAILLVGLLTGFTSNQLEMIAVFILSSIAVIGGVKAAFVGYAGERIYEDLALFMSGIFGFVVGLVVL